MKKVPHGGGDGQPPSPAQLAIRKALKRVEEGLGEHFPEALDPLKAALAVAAVGCLSDNAQPTTLILIARPGAGKSMALNFMMPDGDDDWLNDYVYRSDKLTAASFVSHRADLPKETLSEEVDLLPRIKGKTLLSKELDGTGFVSDSGAHGRRGYIGPINFQWLGATPPLSSEALEVMAQLGPRLLFYDADRKRKNAEELVEYAKHADIQDRLRACWRAVHDFLCVLYSACPPGSVASGSIAVSELHLKRLAFWADVLTRLRALPGQPAEHPERALGMLENIARGSAIAHGQATVNDYDLAQVGHIALSSGVAGRGRVFRALLANGGTATTAEIEKLASMSAPTALRYMEELAAVGLAHFTEGKGNAPATVALVEAFAELCSAPLLKAKWGEGEG